MSRLITFCLLCTIMVGALMGGENLRIKELLPSLVKSLAVEPAVPADFVEATPEGSVSLYDWTYWGPKDVLEKFFKNPDSLDVPLLRVKLSGNVAQTGADSFSDEDSFMKIKEMNPSAFSMVKTKWGSYPVRAIQTEIEGHKLAMAWVGLNDPESGWVLMFNLVYPNKEGRPNKEDLKLWDDFISKTEPLSGRDFIKAHGQDLQDGYTILNVGGVKLKLTAEKRKKDNLMQVVVIPESSNTKFNYRDMDEGLMGLDWRQGEPLLKVYGEIESVDGNATNIINYTVSIFYKSVDEFSVNKEDAKDQLIFQKVLIK